MELRELLHVLRDTVALGYFLSAKSAQTIVVELVELHACSCGTICTRRGHCETVPSVLRRSSLACTSHRVRHIASSAYDRTRDKHTHSSHCHICVRMPHLQPQSAQQLIVVFLCRFFCRFLLSFYFRKKTTTHAPDQEWRSPVRPGRARPWQRRLGPRWATRCVRASEPPGIDWKEMLPVRQGQDPNQTCRPP